MAQSTALPQKKFDRLVAFVKSSDIDKVKGVRAQTFKILGKLGARKKRDITLSPPGIPNAITQFDWKPYLEWLHAIDPGDSDAIQQVLAIDAACNWRIKG